MTKKKNMTALEIFEKNGAVSYIEEYQGKKIEYRLVRGDLLGLEPEVVKKTRASLKVDEKTGWIKFDAVLGHEFIKMDKAISILSRVKGFW